MFITPVTSSNTAPPTSSSNDARSSRWVSERAGGHSNSLGNTDHSLASTIGMSTKPRVTCTPWVTQYSHDGLAGQVGNHEPSNPLSGVVSLTRARLGLYAAYDA